MRKGIRQDHVIGRGNPYEKWKQGRILRVDMLPEEVDDFGGILLDRFPTGLFFPDRYHEFEWGDDVKVEFFPTLTAAGDAARTVVAMFRVPWPEDIASGDPTRLVGLTNLFMASEAQYRRYGRCIEVRWNSDTDGDWHHYHGKIILEGKEVAYECWTLTSRFEILAQFDRNDREVVAFVEEIERLLIDFTTCDFASYNPYTHALINPNRKNASERRSAGIVREVALGDRVYFGTCGRRNKPIEVAGVRPEVRAAIRAEAGLPID